MGPSTVQIPFASLQPHHTPQICQDICPSDLQVNSPTEWPFAERITNWASPANTTAYPPKQFVPQCTAQRTPDSGNETMILQIAPAAQL